MIGVTNFGHTTYHNNRRVPLTPNDELYRTTTSQGITRREVTSMAIATSAPANARRYRHQARGPRIVNRDDDALELELTQATAPHTGDSATSTNRNRRDGKHV